MEIFGQRWTPPPLEGRPYLLLASYQQDDQNLDEKYCSSWFASPHGMLLIRGEHEFVYWKGKSYAVNAIREYLSGGEALPLNEFKNPLKQIQVAEIRLKSGRIGDPQTFVETLMASIQNPEEQAKLAKEFLEANPDADYFGFEGPDNQFLTTFGSIV